MKLTPIPSATALLIASDESKAQIRVGRYSARGEMALGDHPRAGPLGTEQEAVSRELASAHRSEVRTEQADGRDAHQLVDQDLLADNRLRVGHLVSYPDVRSPSRHLPDHHLAGQGPELDAHPGIALCEVSQDRGYQDQARCMARGQRELASARGVQCVQGPGHAVERRQHPAACEATILPAAVSLLPRPFGSPASARSPSPGGGGAWMPLADRWRTARRPPKWSRLRRSRGEGAASGDGRSPSALDAMRHRR